MILNQPLGEFIATLLRKPIAELPVRHELERNAHGILIWRTFEREQRFLELGQPMTQVMLLIFDTKGEN